MNKAREKWLLAVIEANEEILVAARAVQQINERRLSVRDGMLLGDLDRAIAKHDRLHSAPLVKIVKVRTGEGS